MVGLVLELTDTVVVHWAAAVEYFGVGDVVCDKLSFLELKDKVLKKGSFNETIFTGD